jgi:hypothetical protein
VAELSSIRLEVRGPCETAGMSDRHLEIRVAVRARHGGRYMYQIFTVAGEPRTLRSDSKSYASPAEAERAGYEAVAALNGRPQ